MEFQEIDFIEHIEAYLTVNKTVYESLTVDDLKNVRIPLSQLKEGKGFRKLLSLSLIDYLDLEIAPQSKDVNAIVQFIDVLHNSSLLIDDIEDNSLMRRGEQCAHIKYGTALTINCGTYGIFECIDELIGYMDDEQQSKIFTDKKKYSILKSLNYEIMHLHIGQGLEIFWRDVALIVPEFDNYLKMIRLKTSGMLRILGILFIEFFDVNDENKKDSIMRLMDYIGILYQLRDDYLNIVAESPTDIHEGKFSFPILLGINKELKENDNKSLIYDIVTNKVKNPDDVKTVLAKLDEYGIPNSCMKIINELIDHIISTFEPKEESALAYLLKKIKL